MTHQAHLIKADLIYCVRTHVRASKQQNNTHMMLRTGPGVINPVIESYG